MNHDTHRENQLENSVGFVCSVVIKYDQFSPVMEYNFKG